MTTSETVDGDHGDEEGSVKDMQPMSMNERLILLSKPKYQRIVPPLQITSQGEIREIFPYRPMVRWCTQEQLTPVSASALRARASPRVQELATPKKNHQVEKNRDLYSFSCGRTSAMWHVSDKALKAESSERVETLANPKSPPKEYLENMSQFKYSCGRASPMWTTKRRVPSAGPRVTQLARHKTAPEQFQPAKSIQTEIPPAALSANTSEYIQRLAEHKKKNLGPFREPMWSIQHPTLKATPSLRVQELARPKGIADGFVLNLTSPMWPVSRSARKTTPTGRLNELSLPINRPSMDHLLYDPQAFLVKEIALKAHCSNRIQELAVPVNR